MSSNESQSLPHCTVYFDGGCPFCGREIATYRQVRGGNAISWVQRKQPEYTQQEYL